jgi:hypothetical protein
MKQKLLSGNVIGMLSLTVLTMVSMLVIPQSFAQTITNNTTGTNNGWYYSFWNDKASGSASMTLGPGGNYSTTWSNVGNFTAGKGWANGKPDRVICFSGTFDGGSNGFLAIYGWTKNALIEYYVVENYGQWVPPGGTSKGSFTSDGGTYNIYETTRTNQPSIIGTATFQQYWSVRTTRRSSGTVTFANHVAAWKSKGMNMGTTWDYQILESEGYHSSGSSNVTISECNSCATAAPSVTPVINYEVGDVASKLTATGTSLKWYADNSTTTALSGAPTPSTSKVGTTYYYVSQTLNGCEGARAEIAVRVSQTYKIYKVSSPITIDGTPEDAWSNGNVKSFNAGTTLTGTISNTADLSGYGKILWDDNYLYLMADVKDESKKNDSQNAYEDDAVEFYIDINNDKATSYGTNDFQYTFGWNDGTNVGVLPSGGPVTGISYSVVNTNGGYLVEARIPWTTIKGKPSADQLVGIDFMINDDDDGSGRDAKLSWNSATDNAYKDASLFGTAKLTSEEVITGMDIFAVESISVFPNPATSDLYVNGLSGDFEYVVLDYSGRSVAEGKSSEKINIQDLEPGNYILKLKQRELVRITKISKL